MHFRIPIIPSIFQLNVHKQLNICIFH